MMMSYLVGWICIGMAAALAGYLWPFRRGVVGIAVNTGAAVGGAVGAALLGVALGLTRSPGDPRGLLLAGFGALALLAIVHGIWNRLQPHSPRAHG